MVAWTGKRVTALGVRGVTLPIVATLFGVWERGRGVLCGEPFVRGVAFLHEPGAPRESEILGRTPWGQP